MKKQIYTMPMNKKAGEKLLSIWWIFVLLVIGGGILIGVILYYSTDINIKGIEAEILTERIINCITDNGYLKAEVLADNFNITEKCRLDTEVFSMGSNFYFNLSVYKDKDLIKNIIAGDNSIEKDCIIEQKIKAEHFPVCFEQKEIALIDDKTYSVIVLAGSSQIVIKTPNI